MIRKASDISRHRFSRADYHRMIEAGILQEDDRVELLDGEIIAMSPIGPRHNTVVDRLNRFFTKLSGTAFICRTQGSISMPGDSEPEPDIALLRFRDDEYEQALPTPDDVLLIIEVAESSIEKDREAKRDLYAAAGIVEYWVLDLKTDELLVHGDLSNEKYRRVDLITRNHSVQPTALPNITLKISDIL